jgi:hypothetical protein
MAGRKPAEKTVTTMELALCRYLWESNVTKRVIRKKLKWGWRKLDRILQVHEFPNRLNSEVRNGSLEAEKFLTQFAALRGGLQANRTLQHYVDFYDLKNKKRIRESVQLGSLQTSELMFSIHVGVVSILEETLNHLKSSWGLKQHTKKLDIAYGLQKVLLRLMGLQCWLAGICEDSASGYDKLLPELIEVETDSPWDDTILNWYLDQIEKAVGLLPPEN